MPSLMDASSAIYAWDNYPIALFPDLWEWLRNKLKAKKYRALQL